MKKIFQYMFAMIILGLVSGCVNAPEIYVVKSWEGHFYNVEDFKVQTKDINLEKGESIWVISNKTLLKTLENASKR